jgi:hypothetical protein
MSSTYSVINDLYGVGPTRQESERASGLGLFILVLLAGMFLYVSLQPVMRLRSEPPPAFLKGGAAASTAQAVNPTPVAQSYWNTAAGYASGNYTYGQPLPARPPKDFTIAMGGNYATSALYWHRLRGLWNQPEIWVRSYQLDTGWVKPALLSLGKVVSGYLQS